MGEGQGSRVWLAWRLGLKLQVVPYPAFVDSSKARLHPCVRGGLRPTLMPAKTYHIETTPTLTNPLRTQTPPPTRRFAVFAFRRPRLST